MSGRAATAPPASASRLRPWAAPPIFWAASSVIFGANAVLAASDAHWWLAGSQLLTGLLAAVSAAGEATSRR